MPSASSKTSISFGEIAICGDFLDGHREYAFDLLSNLEHIRNWHTTPVPCSETVQGTACTICELCSGRGLIGAITRVLAMYDDAEKRLANVRASLGENAPVSTALSRETLIRNSVAKAIFLSIVTAGDTLRSEHAAWQARLQSEISSSLSLAESSPPYPRMGHNELFKNRGGDRLLPTYSEPAVVRPKRHSTRFSAAAGDALPMSSSSSSLFVVVRRCLSSDCPCEANKVNIASKTNSKGAPSSPTIDRKKHDTKVTAKTDNRTVRPATTNFDHGPWKASGTTEVFAKENTSTGSAVHQTLNCPDARGPETPRSGGGAYAPPSPASGSPNGTSIIDPRVFHLQAQITRVDDTRRALIEWCRACLADLQLDPEVSQKTKFETGELKLKRTHGYGSLDVDKLPDPSSVEVPANQSDNETAQALRFDKQEELEARWLVARQVVGCRQWRRRRSGPNVWRPGNDSSRDVERKW